MKTLHGVYQFSTQALSEFHTWSARSRQRRDMRGLLTGDGRFLKDIGLCRHAIANEAWKPFWQI